MTSAYLITLKLLPAEPTARWEYLVLANGSQAALKKVFRRMEQDTKGYNAKQTMTVESLTRVDATLVR